MGGIVVTVNNRPKKLVFLDMCVCDFVDEYLIIFNI